MRPRWTAWTLIAAAAACGPPIRDPIATERASSGTFTFPYVDPSIPDAPGKFGGPAGTASGAPRIVYPLDGAMHAVNIGALTWQWTRGESSSRLFRIALSGTPTGAVYELYAPCTADNCQFTPPPAAWLTIAYANKGGELLATVEGTDGNGGPVYRSPPMAVRFSPDAVGGGLYYWTKGKDGGTTYRLPFGATKATPFIVPRSATNTTVCGGCHSVSRNGAAISFSAVPGDDTSKGVLITAPTDDPTRPTVKPDSAGAGTLSRFTALNADGSRVLLTTFGQIRVLNTATGKDLDVGNPMALLPRGKLVTHPEWSPSGTRVAFTMFTGQIFDTSGAVIRTVADTRPTDGEIVTMRFDPSTGHLSDLQVIVPMAAGANLFHFYPTWSPDERWLVFVSATSGDGVTAYAARDARLRLARATTAGQTCPGNTCFDLARASHGMDQSSTWPKLTPFAQAGGNVMFVSFSSKMDYGWVLRNLGPDGADRAQLWMAAIDLRDLAVDDDPSRPPTWLPFQDVNQDNHLPFWTEVVVCTTDGISYARCGDGERCINGGCVPIVP